MEIVTPKAGARLLIMPAAAGARWYALHVLSNAVFLLENDLEDAGFQVFAPSYTEQTRWSDRKKTTRRALFPGYIFAKFATYRIPELLRFAGVISVLPNSMNPSPLDDHEIENVRLVMNSQLDARPCEKFTEGDPVLIESGPLAGVRGRVRYTKGAIQVYVEIEMLQRSIVVSIESDMLQKAA